MSDERLQRDDGALLGKLLRAGDSDEPSPQTVQKVLLAVTATASATGAAGAAGAASAAAASGSSTLLSGGVLKWLGIGMLCGVGTSVGVQAVLSSNKAPTPTLAAKTAPLPGLAESAGDALRSAEAVDIQAEQPSRVAEAPIPLPPTAALPAARGGGDPTTELPAQTTPAESGPKTLKDELLVLERARSAASRGDSAAANAAIAQYRQRFPRGRLYPELTLVRIDLLAHGGHHGQARKLAQRFLKDHPKSPSAARLKTRFKIDD